MGKSFVNSCTVTDCDDLLRQNSFLTSCRSLQSFFLTPRFFYSSSFTGVGSSGNTKQSRGSCLPSETGTECLRWAILHSYWWVRQIQMHFTYLCWLIWLLNSFFLLYFSRLWLFFSQGGVGQGTIALALQSFKRLAFQWHSKTSVGLICDTGEQWQVKWYVTECYYIPRIWERGCVSSVSAQHCGPS